MRNVMASRSLIQFLANLLLLVCLIFISGTWLLTPDNPDLDKLVLKYQMEENTFIYGARNNQGGATAGYSYRYYASKELVNDQEILLALLRATPFLITSDPAITIEGTGSDLAVLVKGQVYDFHSRTVIRHTEDDGYTGINISIKADSKG